MLEIGVGELKPEDGWTVGRSESGKPSGRIGALKMRVDRFEKLQVYQLAFALQQRIFQLTTKWPGEERYALSDQLRRASRSIGANISEAWAKRRYEAHFVSKLTDADGELNETRHWLKTAQACDYIATDYANELHQACDEVGGKIGRMIADAGSWTITD